MIQLYLSTSALAPSGGTIKDSSGNDATLTPASPGSAHGYNKDIAIASAPSGIAFVLTNSGAFNTSSAAGSVSLANDVTAGNAIVITGSEYDSPTGPPSGLARFLGLFSKES